MVTKLQYICPKCHQRIVKEVEQESGIIQITCPNPACGYSFPGRVKKPAPASPGPAPQAASPGPAPQAASPGPAPTSASSGPTPTSASPGPQPAPGSPANNPAKDVLPLGHTLLTGEAKDVACPHCGRPTHVDASDAPGMKILACLHCKGPIEVVFRHPTMTAGTVSFPYRGMLQVRGRFFSRKDYPLRVGSNVVGRADKDAPSDIQLDDPYVSRRSAEIVVEVGAKGGFFFRFRVLSAKNPVLVNSQRFDPGSEILLNYGDIITMGRTRLRFCKIAQ